METRFDSACYLTRSQRVNQAQKAAEEKCQLAVATHELHVNPVCEMQPPISFKSEAGTAFSVSHGPPPLEDVFQIGGDWQVQFDFEDEAGVSKPFPPEIAIVSGEGSRPDGVMWSMATQTVVWIELTSPWEENFTKNFNIKRVRYNQLAEDLRNGNHVGGLKWNVIPLYVEIGARGAIHEHSWSWMCRRLRIWGKARQRLRTAVQDTAIYCSHFLFINRFQKIWERKPLLDCWKVSKGAQEK